MQAETVDDPGLLAESVGTHRQAVAAAPDGHPDRAARLSNLGTALEATYDLMADPAPLAR